MRSNAAGAVMIPVLISRISRCAGVASRSSTIAVIPPSVSRTTRPRPAGRSTFGGNDRQHGAIVRCEAGRKHLRTDQRNITKQDQHRRVGGDAGQRLCHRVTGSQLLRLLPPTRCRARRQTQLAPVLPRDRPRREFGSGFSARAAPSTCASNGRPARSCRTFGNFERMRVPCPAASTMTSRLMAKESVPESAGL